MKRQPRWPDHFDPVPPCLQPWRPDHYALLLLWIFFQPSRLKNYLYRADPDLYTQTGWANFWRAMTRVPAYRNVWLMGFPMSKFNFVAKVYLLPTQSVGMKQKQVGIL